MFKLINPLYKFSYKATVDAQINLYKKLRPQIISHNDEGRILNELINSRIRAELTLPEFSRKDPKTFYAEMLNDKEKTLIDVILSIIYFEFIESRKDSLKKIRVQDRLNFMAKVKAYTERQIAKM